MRVGLAGDSAILRDLPVCEAERILLLTLLYCTVSSCFRWPIRAYHVHFSAMDTVGTACYRWPMKTLITVAAVALLGYCAFSWLLAAPFTVLVIGAAIWIISL